MLEIWAEVVVEQPGFWYFSCWVIGSCFGSFLNVVIYRLPRGINLSKPGSHCPKCQHAIRWWHNIPVLGWLLLRGKCYDCRAPIPARYPIVELHVGIAWAGLAWMGHSHWPFVIAATEQLHGETVTTYHWQLQPVLTWLSASICTTVLIAMSYIKYDGQRVPRSLWIWAIVSGGLFGYLLWSLA